jgi:anthranilate phosphoribosyltransferase
MAPNPQTGRPETCDQVREELHLMPLTAYIKEVGRGATGARSLSFAQAGDAFGTLLDGRASALQTGAFVMAMRVKGETLEELGGFLDALHSRCLAVSSDSPVVLLPSYNGARRLPNLTPLLAMHLAQQGARVLVHGVARDPARVTTAAVLHDLGLPSCDDETGVHSRWARRQPAFLTAATLCGGLQRLLDVRWSVGLRNSGHSVAKMLNPVRGTRVLRVVNTTHPEFARMMADWAAASAADVLLLRGTEGEPVADARRQPRMDGIVGGQSRPDLSLPAQEGVLTDLPLLPRDNDASTTALYIQAVLGGEKPLPGPIAAQSALLLRMLDTLGEPVPMSAGLPSAGPSG